MLIMLQLQTFIDLSTPIAKRKKMMEDKVSHSQSFDSFVPSPSEDELKMFYNNLSQSKPKPGICFGYAHMYKVDHSILSLPLSSLFKSTCLNMSYTDLLVKCENVFQDLTISKQQCKNIEVSTRDQAQYPYLGTQPRWIC